ncbi:MAG: hypothetical protein OCD01_05050 [Fibrobacterales bacterium]
MKMLKQIMIGAVLLASVFAGNAFAGDISTCVDVQIKNLIVEGDRDDGATGADVSNKILLIPKNTCNTNTVFYINLKETSYSAMFTLLLNAKNSGAALDITYDVDSALPSLSTWREIKVVNLK